VTFEEYIRHIRLVAYRRLLAGAPCELQRDWARQGVTADIFQIVLTERLLKEWPNNSVATEKNMANLSTALRRAG
jgi:hypothetical protein